jgi:hypothetical protein
MLEQCVITGGQDKERGKPLIDDVVLGNITAFLATWGPLVRQLDIKQAGRSKEVRESGSAASELETYIRDVWVVEKRRITREGLPPEVLLYYGLDMNAELPHSGTRAQLLQWGKTIVDGDAAAVAAGYEAIANPSALQVNAKLTAAQTEADQVAMRDRDFDEAQQAVSTGRARAEELIYEVMDQLRFNLRKLDAADQRRVMRSYGATFSYETGEAVDAEDAAPAGAPEPAAVATPA